MKFYHSQVNGWNSRTSYEVKLFRLRMPKVTCSPSQVYYRPKTNTAILLDMVCILRGDCKQEGYGK
jgi:hypothetical protein